MAFPKVNHWQLSFIKREFKTTTSFTESVVNKKVLKKGINYAFVPVEYRKQSFSVNYLVNVVGYDLNNNKIVTEKNIQLNDNNGTLLQTNGGIPYAPNCYKECIGATYAYAIQQYLKQTSPTTGISRFRLKRTHKAFDSTSQTANPYYWYTNQDIGPAANGLNKISFYIQSGVPNGLHVQDPGGNYLTGWVYGYAKLMGVWEGSDIIETGGQFSIGDDFCGNLTWTLNTTINLMNSSAPNLQLGNPSNYPPLKCIPAQTGGGGGTIPMGNPTPPSSFTGFVKFCFNPYTDLEEPCEKGTEGGNGGINPIINLLNADSVDQIIITDLNDNSKAPIYVNVSELYKTNNGNGGISNGDFNGINFKLTKGLYSFGFMFKNNGYWAAVKEIKKDISFKVTQADMVDVTVYANPIVGTKYHVKIDAKATVKMDYELRDFFGNLVLTRNFVVHKDQEKIVLINKNNIPNGILFHRFIFEDGSVKAIQSLKN